MTLAGDGDSWLGLFVFGLRWATLESCCDSEANRRCAVGSSPTCRRLIFVRYGPDGGGTRVCPEALWSGDTQVLVVGAAGRQVGKIGPGQSEHGTSPEQCKVNNYAAW